MLSFALVVAFIWAVPRVGEFLAAILIALIQYKQEEVEHTPETRETSSCEKKYNVKRQRELQEDLARNIIQNRSIRSEIDHILGYEEVNLLFRKTNSLAHFMNCMISFSAKEEMWTVAHGISTESWDRVIHSPLEKRDLSHSVPMDFAKHDKKVEERNKKRREEFLDREIPRH